jgi:multidrug resistance efflux pump
MEQPKLKWRVLMTCVVIALAVVAVVVLYWRETRHPWTRDGQVSADVVQITPQVSGMVVRVMVEDNEPVREGDLLFEIDPRDFELRVASARIAIDEARQEVAALEAAIVAREANVRQARAGVETAEAQLESALAEVANAEAAVTSDKAGIISARAYIDKCEADLAEAIRERDRAKRLADEGAGSVANAESKAARVESMQAALDDAHAQATQAQARLEQAQAELNRAQADRAKAIAGISESEAAVASAIAGLEQSRADLGVPGEQNTRIQSAKVELENAELDLSWTRVYAPADGYVTNVTLDVGDQANTGTGLMAFVDSGSFYVQGFFRETQLRHIKPGDRAIVTLMAHPGQPIEGVVDSIGWAINPPDVATTEGPDGLVPQVEPSFDWIRLAQRVPVHVQITEVPEGVQLISGVTASVVIKPSD